MYLCDMKDVDAFLNAVNACKGAVYLRTPDGYQFNLKSSFSQYVAIGKLIEEGGNQLEIFADDMEDWGKIYGLIKELKQHHAE